MTYLKHKDEYYVLVRKFLSSEISAHTFTMKFIEKWGIDRDCQYAEIDKGELISKEEANFCGHLDLIFSACDCYEPVPEDNIEIDENQLRIEVRQVLANCWGEI